MIRRMHHTSLTVADMERSLGFYRDLLDMPVVADQGGKGGYLAKVTGFTDVDLRVVFVKPTPGAYTPGYTGELIELIEYRSPKGTPADVRTCNPGAAHLCFVIDDIHPLYEKLHSAGITFRSEPQAIVAGRHKGGFSCYLLDPDGVTIELMQLPEGMA